MAIVRGEARPWRIATRNSRQGSMTQLHRACRPFLSGAGAHGMSHQSARTYSNEDVSESRGLERQRQRPRLSVADTSAIIARMRLLHDISSRFEACTCGHTPQEHLWGRCGGRLQLPWRMVRLAGGCRDDGHLCADPHHRGMVDFNPVSTNDADPSRMTRPPTDGRR